ncbi:MULTISPECIES: malonate transporter subunit MadL [Rhodopseudomonas]|uniref:Malonate transporter n=1 Tax=Rhodopseudomonas palustris TaxID=1076 RepID=A0A0D7EJY5_RHOPL|nr:MULTISPECIES: malonate transporter subunit MadL [Rhodopseudomonas]KIZ40830.1 malonate transporter [Rhodopseudomonas palustris]MDF3812451.1 malonate transporter subunit MadL [Rhodopseudomonas sp. BAL398]WOK19450.1 malonate transporter subunit MadL [Rhodopseudomonas sp. BAL398]
MVIYGVMVLGLCMFIGTAIGLGLGNLLNIPGDIGGVGFAMLLLVFVTPWLKKNGWLPKPSEDGIMFWNGMYIPVVIAMAATQNVAAAMHGGAIAFVGGLLSVIVCFVLIRPLSALAGSATSTFGDETEAPSAAPVVVAPSVKA